MLALQIDGLFKGLNIGQIVAIKVRSAAAAREGVGPRIIVHKPCGLADGDYSHDSPGEALGVREVVEGRDYAYLLHGSHAGAVQELALMERDAAASETFEPAMGSGLDGLAASGNERSPRRLDCERVVEAATGPGVDCVSGI